MQMQIGPYLLSMHDTQRHAVVVIPLSSLTKKDSVI